MQYHVKETFYLQGQLWPAGSAVEANPHIAVELMELGFLEDARPTVPVQAQENFATKINRSKRVVA